LRLKLLLIISLVEKEKDVEIVKEEQNNIFEESELFDIMKDLQTSNSPLHYFLC
jgi:hypothetical protein